MWLLGKMLSALIKEGQLQVRDFGGKQIGEHTSELQSR